MIPSSIRRQGPYAACRRPLRLFIRTFSRLLLSAEHTTAALLRGRLTLHLLRDFDVDFEELAHTAVEADGLALVEVGFAVLGRNALLGAGIDEPGKEMVSTLLGISRAGHVRWMFAVRRTD